MSPSVTLFLHEMVNLQVNANLHMDLIALHLLQCELIHRECRGGISGERRLALGSALGFFFVCLFLLCNVSRPSVAFITNTSVGYTFKEILMCYCSGALSQ